MIAHHTLVAEQDGELVGFTELEPEGHVDMLYCRSDVIGRGVGRRLYAALEAKAIAGFLARFRGREYHRAAFLHAMCFHVIQQQTVIRRGISLTNFKMEKTLI